jgi:hypothetical protein
VGALAASSIFAAIIGSDANGFVSFGEPRMKKFAIAFAAAGLMSLGACHSKSPEAAAVENNADMMADNMDAAADNISAMADNSSNTMASDMMSNAADNMHDSADNVRDEGKATAKNMQ